MVHVTAFSALPFYPFPSIPEKYDGRHRIILSLWSASRNRYKYGHYLHGNSLYPNVHIEPIYYFHGAPP